MAKKVVATLRKLGSKNLVKLITSVRSKKTQAYTFKEEIMTLEQAKEVVGVQK
jgi:hypothetical protein